MRTSIVLFVVAGALLAGGIALWLWRSAQPAYDPGEEEAVRSVVTDFGRRINGVSLLAPDKAVRRQIRDAYAPFVSDTLLAAWLEQPANAPGRLTSSPWPDRIEIARVRRVDDVYKVDGTIVLMTSTEMMSASEDNAGEQPVTLTVAQLDGEWRITKFRIRPGENTGNESYIAPDNSFALQYLPKERTPLASDGEAAIMCGPKHQDPYI